MMAKRMTDITGIERNSMIQGKMNDLIIALLLEIKPSTKPIIKERIPPRIPRKSVMLICIQKSSLIANSVSVINDFNGEGKI